MLKDQKNCFHHLLSEISVFCSQQLNLPLQTQNKCFLWVLKRQNSHISVDTSNDTNTTKCLFAPQLLERHSLAPEDTHTHTKEKTAEALKTRRMQQCVPQSYHLHHRLVLDLLSAMSVPQGVQGVLHHVRRWRNTRNLKQFSEKH